MNFEEVVNAIIINRDTVIGLTEKLDWTINPDLSPLKIGTGMIAKFSFAGRPGVYQLDDWNLRLDPENLDDWKKGKELDPEWEYLANFRQTIAESIKFALCDTIISPMLPFGKAYAKWGGDVHKEKAWMWDVASGITKGKYTAIYELYEKAAQDCEIESKKA